MKRLLRGLRLLLPAVAACALVFGILRFYDFFEINADWIRTVVIDSASKLDSNVFERLVEGGAIWPMRGADSLAIAHTPCTFLTARAPELSEVLPQGVGAVPTPAGMVPDPRAGGQGNDTSAKYVRELCQTGEGRRIRAAIAAFNRSIHLVGIRDTRFAPTLDEPEVRCSDGRGTAELFVPPSCLVSSWEAFLQPVGRSMSLVAVSNVSMREYAFLATNRTGYFSEWSVAAPALDGPQITRQLIAFRSDIQRITNPLSIDVIGAPEAVRIWGARVDGALVDDDWIAVGANGRVSGEVLDAGGHRVVVSVETNCARDDGSRGAGVRCGRETVGGRPIGARITLETQASNSPLVVEVLVRPMAVIPRSLRPSVAEPDPINLQRATTGAERLVSMRLDPIELDCLKVWQPNADGTHSLGETDTGCRLVWHPLTTSDTPHETEERAVQITAGGQPLLEDSGSLTRQAFEEGFADLVGLGPDDPASLVGVFSEHSEFDEVPLTLDPAMQRLAIDVIDGRERPCAPFLSDRCRADLVVMRASGTGAGEILVAASRPAATPGLSWWDVLALELGDPDRSPVAGHPWRAHDVRSTPGSSFKPLVALAAAQHVLDTPDPELESILLGTASDAVLLRRLGVIRAEALDGDIWREGVCEPSSNETAIYNAIRVPRADGTGVSHCIGNFRKGSDRPPSIFNHRDTGCLSERSGAHLGICEAIMHSSNLFFSGLALSIDMPLLLLPGSDVEHSAAAPDLALARYARRLFPDQTTTPDSAAPVFDILSVDYGRSGRTRADPLVIDATREAPPGEPRRLRLANAGIGQAVTATPVAMASVAASIASRRVVRPHAIPATVRGPATDPIEGTPLLVAPPGREALRERLLTQIESGMRAVVTSGTAARQFSGSPVRDFVYGKTGTADLRQREPNNALWFIGYVLAPGGGSGITEDLAFACRVAYASGTGGGVCGALMETFLEALHNGEGP